MRTLAVSQRPRSQSRLAVLAIALVSLLVTGLVAPTAQAASATPAQTAVQAAVIDPAQAPAPTLAITGPAAGEDPAIRHYLGTMPLAWQVPELTGIQYSFTDASGQPDEPTGVRPVGQVQATYLGDKTAADPDLYVVASAVFTINGKVVWGPWSRPVAVFKDGQPVPVSSPAPNPSPTKAKPTKRPPGYKCGNGRFFGVRGSGEHAWDGHGYGTTVDDFRRRLTKAVPGLTSEAIDYPAIAVPLNVFSIRYLEAYTDSVLTGRDVLVKAIQDYKRYCPGKRIYGGAYSQGVDVFHAALAILNGFNRLDRGYYPFVAIAYFGDPHLDPLNSVTDQGDFNSSLSGILIHFGDGQTRVSYGHWDSHIHSYCTEHDAICGWSIQNLGFCNTKTPTCGHMFYVERGWTAKAAKWASAA